MPQLYISKVFDVKRADQGISAASAEDPVSIEYSLSSYFIRIFTFPLLESGLIWFLGQNILTLYVEEQPLFWTLVSTGH